jgi:hypothetical protein
MIIKGKIQKNKTYADRSTNILLAHLPYWDPLIPPMGIATLKSFLQPYGYNVKTVDLNVVPEFKQLYNDYFDTFKKYIPQNRRGNFYNIGHDVLQNHLMAYINRKYKHENEYLGLIKTIIDNIFFCNVQEYWVKMHDELVAEFYKLLEKYFLNLLEQENPGVLGLTVYKATLPAAMFVFRLAKKKNRNIKTIMGGGIFADTMGVDSPNLDFFLEKTKDYIDKIMIGKGEIFLLKELRGELPESQRVFTMKDIGVDVPGHSLSHAIFPDLSDFDLRHYPYIAASASSGCPFQCKFCNSPIYYGKYREKEPKQVVEEMVKLYDRYRCQQFFMTDALLNPIISELAKEFINTNISLYFDGYFRVDKAAGDIDNTWTWRQGGFYRARLGIESGSQRILNLMNKGITLRQTKDTLSSLAYAGIKTTAYVVIGYPGETEEDFRRTLDLLEEVQNDIWQAECIPFAYYYNGQAGSDQWANKRKLLYPGTAADMLIIQTWIVDGEPSREEIYNRVFRFDQHCKKIGIPNPYSLEEIYKSDERWKKLHKNAVPSLVELMNRDANVSIQESKRVRKLHFAQNNRRDTNDFAFK